MYTRGHTPSTPAIYRGKTAQVRPENSGIRPTTSRSLEDCVIKDSAHYRRKLGMKITQMKTELYAMKEEINGLNADERRTEYRAKQAQTKAKELTELQDLLSDHLTAMDKANMSIKISEIVKESAHLKEVNDSIAIEKEKIYANRLHQEQKVEKLKKEVSSVISNTALRGVKQAVLNDPKKTEQVRMELQLWELIQQRDSLMENAEIECKDTTCEEGIESDIDLLHVVLGDKLNDMVISIREASKLRKYERVISENHTHRIKDCPPRQLLNYLECYLSQLKTQDKYITRAAEQLTAKSLDLKGICVNSLNVSSLNDDLERAVTDLKTQKSIIECQRRTSTDKLNSTEGELRAMERQLMGNEQYKTQRLLENKLSEINEMNHSIEEYLEEGRSLNDIHKCKERTLNTINRLNAKIISNLNQ